MLIHFSLHLLANYYSVVHSTIGARMQGTEGNMKLKSSPGKRLEKARHKIFGKLMLLIPSLKQHADWQKWEPTIGGKFPRVRKNKHSSLLYAHYS